MRAIAETSFRGGATNTTAQGKPLMSAALDAVKLGNIIEARK